MRWYTNFPLHQQSIQLVGHPAATPISRTIRCFAETANKHDTIINTKYPTVRFVDQLTKLPIGRIPVEGIQRFCARIDLIDGLSNQRFADAGLEMFAKVDDLFVAQVSNERLACRRRTKPGAKLRISADSPTAHSNWHFAEQWIAPNSQNWQARRRRWARFNLRIQRWNRGCYHDFN